MSLPEVMLWQRLRRRQGGARFRRQHPVAGYVIDFYCADARLAIEVDGQSHLHGDHPVRDTRREAVLASTGLTVIHIAASDVLADPNGVAARIAALASPLHRPAGGPPPHAPHGEDQQGVF